MSELQPERNIPFVPPHAPVPDSRGPSDWDMKHEDPIYNPESMTGPPNRAWYPNGPEGTHAFNTDLDRFNHYNLVSGAEPIRTQYPRGPQGTRDYVRDRSDWLMYQQERQARERDTRTNANSSSSVFSGSPSQKRKRKPSAYSRPSILKSPAAPAKRSRPSTQGTKRSSSSTSAPSAKRSLSGRLTSSSTSTTPSLAAIRSAFNRGLISAQQANDFNVVRHAMSSRSYGTKRSNYGGNKTAASTIKRLMKSVYNPKRPKGSGSSANSSFSGRRSAGSVYNQRGYGAGSSLYGRSYSRGRSAGSSLYRNAANAGGSIASNGVVGGAPTIISTGTSPITIRKREFVGDIQTQTAGLFLPAATINLNPGSYDTSSKGHPFNWIQGIAHHYDLYRWKKLVFTYKSTSGTSIGSQANMGSCLMAVQLDSSDAAFASKADLLNAGLAADGAPYQTFSMDVLKRPVTAKLPLNWLYVRNTDQVTTPGVGGADVRFFDIGRFSLYLDRTSAAGGQVLGELWVDYEIELCVPTAKGIKTLASAHFENAAYTSQASSGTAGLIAASTNHPSIVANTFVNTRGIQLYAPGKYLFTIHAVQTAGVGTFATLVVGDIILSADVVLETDYFNNATGFIHSFSAAAGTGHSVVQFVVTKTGQDTTGDVGVTLPITVPVTAGTNTVSVVQLMDSQE